MRNAAIAHALGIRPATVEKHLEHCYRKLGVGGRMASRARPWHLVSRRASCPTDGPANATDLV